MLSRGRGRQENTHNARHRNLSTSHSRKWWLRNALRAAAIPHHELVSARKEDVFHEIYPIGKSPSTLSYAHTFIKGGIATSPRFRNACDLFAVELNQAPRNRLMACNLFTCVNHCMCDVRCVPSAAAALKVWKVIQQAAVIFTNMQKHHVVYKRI